MLMSDEKLLIYTDAAYNDRQPAGIAAALFEEGSDTPIYMIGRKVNAQDNTEAELLAVLYALEEIPQKGQQILLCCDNSSAVEILNGAGNVVPWLSKIAKRIESLVDEEKLDVTFQWIPRSENRVADAGAGVAARNGSLWVFNL